jgi:hypothetical protein
VNRSGVAGSKNEIRETVQAFEERCFPTSSRAEDGQYLLALNSQTDIPQGLEGVIIKTEIFDDHFTF